MIDVEAVRANTPAVASTIHLNNCGSSLPPQPVVEGAVEYLRLEAEIGGYEAYWAREDQMNVVYHATARYLGCDPTEVAYTSGAGDSWWRAFAAIPLDVGDRVLASTAEYQANAFALLQARERGVIVEVVPNDATGLIDLEVLRSMIDDRVKLVVLTHIAMANGAIQPASAVGQIAHEAGALFLLDSCQAAGQLPLDVDSLNCDFLAYTGRKFMRAMRGSGILYARSSVLDQLGHSPFIDGRSAVWTGPDTFEYQPGAQRFEYGEHNYSGKLALGLATNYALDVGIPAITERIATLAKRFRSGLRSIPNVQLLDLGLVQSGIVTFSIDGQDCPSVQRKLQVEGINVGAPGRTNSQWDLGERGLLDVVRAGLHYFNTEAEIDRTLEAVAAIA
ncbi:MAG: aminotransferase class V-fold PLP-dependent enzyme [Acidimicrobiales bacterium]|nr:aminotransferase class V-fold PLP-dependent enzyme [Acidimicrobiales bacterium]